MKKKGCRLKNLRKRLIDRKGKEKKGCRLKNSEKRQPVLILIIDFQSG